MIIDDTVIATTTTTTTGSSPYLPTGTLEGLNFFDASELTETPNEVKTAYKKAKLIYKPVHYQYYIGGIIRHATIIPNRDYILHIAHAHQ